MRKISKLAILTLGALITLGSVIGCSRKPYAPTLIAHLSEVPIGKKVAVKGDIGNTPSYFIYDPEKRNNDFTRTFIHGIRSKELKKALKYEIWDRDNEEITVYGTKRAQGIVVHYIQVGNMLYPN